MTSGLVRIGDRARLGTGIYIEPHLEIGRDAQVASGAVIINSVPPGHAVKSRVATMTTVPIREPGRSDSLGRVANAFGTDTNRTTADVDRARLGYDHR
jgi:acetyltransferase-like isoleucine patch superfamily enzyme